MPSHQVPWLISRGTQSRFRWAECQLHSIERLRGEKQIRNALRNLPGDLAQTYVRIFEAIPEVDRAFVRRALIWIDGHNNGWAFDSGINANVLLRAVAFDLNGPSSNTEKLTYDLDDLQDLCGCLITISGPVEEQFDIKEGAVARSVTSALPPSSPSISSKWEGSGSPPTPDFTDWNYLKSSNQNPRELFVSLAHYTVEEFLSSELILSTPVSFYSLSGSFEAEYCLSALRQALGADPMDQDDNWITNREAYCLVLSCCANQRDDMARIPGALGMIERYYDPTGRHFRRIQAIQDRIGRDKSDALAYYVWTLASDVRNASTGEGNGAAGVLLNLLLGSSPIGMLNSFSTGKDIESLLRTRLTASFPGVTDLPSDGPRRHVIEGTIYEIMATITGLSFRGLEFEGGRWSTAVHTGRCVANPLL